MKPLLLSALAITVALTSGNADETSANSTRLEKFLVRFPSSDADGDGILTLAEAEAFRSRETPSRSAPTPETNKKTPPGVRRYTTTELAERFEDRRFNGVPYRFFEPPALDKESDQRYPLILSLHGAGGKGTDNLKNLRSWNGTITEPGFQQKHPCFIVAPQTEIPWRVAGPAPDLSDETIASFPEIWRQTVTARKSLITEFGKGDLGTVFELLDSLAETYAIDLDRVYVLGHSMGGYGSWEAIAVAPDRFAAAVPTAGEGFVTKLASGKCDPTPGIWEWLFNQKRARRH